MASSDSDEFASADEATSTDGHERRRRSKRQSSSNYDSEEGTPGAILEQAGKTSHVKPITPAVEPKLTDGWDDFDIEEDITEPHSEPSIKSTQSAKPMLTDDKDDKPSEPDIKPEPEIKPQKERQQNKLTAQDEVTTARLQQVTKTSEGEDGWDKFHDWGDDTQPITTAPTKTSQEEDKIKSVADRLSGLNVKENTGGGGGWGWGGWGVESLLSTATAGISTITSSVSHGISSVSTALESGIGAPDPEDLARRNLEGTDEKSEQDDRPAPAESQDAGYVSKSSSSEGSFAFGSIMSGVSHITKFVENTGSKVISGGLDTLETIGKKTMEVLQDGDPGLAKKRAMLGLDSGPKPVLSQLLREAKARADEEDRIREEKREAKEVHYETLFDDFEGLVHLEALEMLSRQVGMRIEERMRVLSPDKRLEMKETLQQVAELCELADSDDECEEETRGQSDHTGPETLLNRLREATQDIGVNVQFQALFKQYEETLAWLGAEESSERALYKRCVSALAQCTALCVEVYHKTAEMLLVKSRRSTADEADALTQMTTVLTKHIGHLSSDFTRKVNTLRTDENKEQINTYAINIYLEAANSSKYIQNAFQLTLPILQIGAA